MNSNSFGDKFKISTFGESHGPAMGVVIDGVQPNLDFDLALLKSELKKRAPGKSKFSTSRNEPDNPEIISGVFKGKTLGTPICIIFRNRESQPKDYEELKNLFRPGHGDFTWLKKFGIRDYRGGGRSSGRETVARVAGGAVAKMILNNEGIEITSFCVEIAGIKSEIKNISESRTNSLQFCDSKKLPEIEKKLSELKESGDSAGAIVELNITGVKPGVGDPVFQKLEANLASAVISIGGVKGVEFGAGFKGASMKGSEHNDSIYPDGFHSNNAGGFLGGISTGQPMVMRVAIKPVSSISIPQKTVDINGVSKTISTKGRHDTVLVPRIISVLEAMVAVTIADALLNQYTIKKTPPTLLHYRKTVEDIDNEILLSLKKRDTLSREIGILKRAACMEIENLEVEKRVIERWNKIGDELSLNRDFLNTLLSTIFKESKRVQTPTE